MASLHSCHVSRSQMNQLIMNYLVTEGFKEAAEKFRVEARIEPPMELDLLDDRIRLRSLVQNGQIQEAINLVNNLYPELLDKYRYLYFRLQQQKLIELIREKDVEGALSYAQQHLVERVEENPDVLTELEKTLALLAFENPENSPFGELLHISQRQKVASELNAAVLDVEATPELAGLLKMLLWSQDELDKRKVKYPHMTDIAQGKVDDPK